MNIINEALASLLAIVLLTSMSGCGGSSAKNQVVTTANAGPDHAVATGALVTLDGSNSHSIGDALTYSWSFKSKPASSLATLSSATVSAPTFTADKNGSYVLSLIVNDGKTNSAPDTVVITALASWTWISGSNTPSQTGTYGTKGVADAANSPGARTGSVSWKDSSGSFWLFGGRNGDVFAYSFFNDLWKFDGTNWTWISGSNTMNQAGTYGAKGIADAANLPPARAGAVSWADSSGNLWLYGGDNSYGRLNDLWRFDGTNWTWISGSNNMNQAGTYGAKGIADAANLPPARTRAVSWADSSGNLWLFGGNNSSGLLNDLWKFDGTNWTWISGANTPNQAGTYGTKGIANAANIPGARMNAVSWIDSSNNLWLFGGASDASGGGAVFNDLWKFDGTNWVWISGAKTITQAGTYGTKGIANSANVPGARYMPTSWIDSNNNLWLFGGLGYGCNVNLNNGGLNDLWKFDWSNWTWISGSNTLHTTGVYGTKGVADPANVPGARVEAVSWIDNRGNLWLFGGDMNNDLWKFQP